MKNLGRNQGLAIILILFSLSTSSLIACEELIDTTEAQVAETDQLTTQGNSMLAQLELMPAEELSNEERDGLIFLREEEKLARDVYIYFQAYYPEKVFINIPKSEQQHMDAVKFLLDRYSITDPIAGKVSGEFINQELQDLYNTLTSKGKENVTEALKVGALIEEVDIEDLEYELNNHVDNQDIKFVYGNLNKGSKNHLRAFTNTLKTYGVIYLPVILEESYYNEIVL